MYLSAVAYFTTILSLQDCTIEDLNLFASHCLPGPFGGQVSPSPDYQCSVQSSENSPDWFPFLCVISPPDNNPYLGLFFKGDTMWEATEYIFCFVDSVINICFHNESLINVSPLTCLVNQSLVHPSKILPCQLQCQLMFIFKEVPFTRLTTSTSLFPR